MPRSDYFVELMSSFGCDPRCPPEFAARCKAVLSTLSTSSSLTSRRYPVWPIVREHLDEVFDCCVKSYSNADTKVLLGEVRLSEMAKRPPLFFAEPRVSSAGVVVGRWDFKVVASNSATAKPENEPEIDWQLGNLSCWDSNLRYCIHSLLSPAAEHSVGVDALCGVFDSVRELFQLFRHFRPKETKALSDFDALVDDRTRPQSGMFCELCWRESIRSKALENINEREQEEVYGLRCLGGNEQAGERFQGEVAEAPQAITSTVKDKANTVELIRIREKYRRARITAGNLSSRYCSIHKPGSSKYHADLRYKAAFNHHLSALLGMKKSDFAFNFKLPSSPDMQEIRKTAYDQVHSGLHVNAAAGKASLGQREKIYLLLREGLNQSEIARRMGVSRQAISKAKKSLEALANSHLAGRYINPNTGEAQVSGHIYKEIRDALSRGLSVSAIAKQVGLGKGTVDGLVRLMRAPG